MRNRRWQAYCILFVYVFLTVLILVAPVQAHEGPEGDEYQMADWMLLSFLIFFGAALTVFVVALRRGYFENLEQAKYYLLTIDEPDYYTPDWAKDEEEEEDEPEQRE